MCQKALRPLERSRRSPPVRRRLRLSEPRHDREEGARGLDGEGRERRDGVPERAVAARVKLDDVRRAVEFGADEIDMVIDRGAMLAGDYRKVFDEIAATKEACGEAHLKVILETGELGTLRHRPQGERDRDRRRRRLHQDVDRQDRSPRRRRRSRSCMLEAIRDHFYATGRKIGMKPAGGIRTAKQALHYLVLVKETLGDALAHARSLPLRRERRSSNDVLMQLEERADGRYQAGEDFSKD